MTVVHRSLPLLIAGALGVASLGVSASEFRTAARPIQGQYIVVLKEEVAALGGEMNIANRPSVATMAQNMARQHGAQMRQHFTHALRGFVVQANDRALQRLLMDDRVAYVEEDGIVELSATQSNATWGLDRIDQRDLPLNTTYVYDTTASNVNTYIIDTGVLGTHSQFTGRMIGGYTAISDGRGTSDCNGHGTHVAGTVAGTTHGVAKGAKISPIRVLGCNGSGTNSGVIAGMDWVTANHVKPAVANMSLGGGASQATDDAVARMTNAGVVVVVAAGNDNSNACNYSPARAPSAITVGSTQNNDARSSFSNFGSCLDIFAPGTNITSAWYTSNTATNTISGTSMAAPHVAGVAALYMANNPTASVSQVTNALNSAATPNKVTSAGSGSPNRLLYSLFSGGGGGDTTAPTTPGNLGATAASSSQINLSWSASSDAGGSGLAGYRVERCQGSSCTNFAEIATTTSTSYAATGLAASTAYRFRVRAYDGAGNNSSYSAIASATTQGGGGGGGTTLSKGVPVSNLSGSAGTELRWTMDVPAGATNLSFAMSGGSGDADLYVRFGSAPTTSTYNCRPYLNGNNETCSFAAPSAGTYHVMIRGYSAFSGVSLVGDYTAGGGGGAQTYSNTTDYQIRDNTTVDSPIAVSGRSGNAPSNTQVDVRIIHTYIGDLRVQLVAPDGSLYTLHNRTGGSADNIIGSYTVNLSSEALNGTWRLRVADLASGDTGYIDSWSITF